MTRQNKKTVFIAYIIVFYTLWTAFELCGYNFIDHIIANECLSQFIKSGILKNLIWTLPAVLLIHRFSSSVCISLKEMFTTKVNWLKFAPLFIFFTIWLFVSSILQNGRLKIADGFGMKEIIIVLFVGITEEIVFRGWLLNAAIDEEKKWMCILTNAVLFLAIHFPCWIRQGIFFSRFAGFDFLGILVLSVLFSDAFLKSRSILVPITLHMYWDLLIFLLIGG